MAVSKGKQFEAKIKEQLEALPDVLVERLYDVMNGYSKIKTPADFIVYKGDLLYYVECKSIHGPSIPLDNLTQLEELEKRCAKNPNVRGVFLIWFVDKQITYCVDCKYVREQLKQGLKRFNYLTLLNTQDSGFCVLQGVYKRVYGVYDFTNLWSM